MRYFFGIEVVRSKKGIVISKQKYTLDLLKEIRKLCLKPVETTLVQDQGLYCNAGDLLNGPRVVANLGNFPLGAHYVKKKKIFLGCHMLKMQTWLFSEDHGVHM